MLKLIVGVTWLACLINLIIPFPAPFDLYIQWLLMATVVAHIIECLIFSSRVQRAGGNKALNYFLVFIFGYAHAMHLPKH